MSFMFTAKGFTNTFRKFIGRERSIWLDNPPLTMSPFRFNRVEPGTLDWQVTDQDSHPLTTALDSLIVFPYPTTHLFADMPRRVIPYHSQHRLVHRHQLLATPFKELDGNVTDGASVYETQQDSLIRLPIFFHPVQQHTITRQRFRIWVIFYLVLFNQTQRLPWLDPGRQAGLGKTAPPSLVLKAPGPSGLLRQCDYSVARLFFRTYSGSGLVIQCLARFQEMLERFRAMRMQSSLTNRGVIPVAKLTSAANCSVHKLVFFPNSRGLRCSKDFNFSARSLVKIASVVFGRLEPICRAASLRSLNELIAFRTVCSSQPRNSAMRGTLWPRALAKMIWLRRTVKGLDERNPAFSLWRSSSDNSRTKIGFLMSTIILFS